MKKLLHLQLLPLLSGVQRFSLYLLEGLDSREFEIWVACRPGGEFPEAVKRRGFHFISLPSFRHPISYTDFFTFLHLILIIKRYRFDIVHTNSSKPGLLGRLAARICKVPLIIHTAHGTPFQESQSKLKYRFFTFMEAWGNSLGHKTVFVNNSDRLNCLKLGLISEKKAYTVFNALPLMQSEILEQIANKRCLPEGEIIIGSTIRFSDQKNVISLITAACLACKQSIKLKFIFVGDGEHLELCKAIIRTHGLETRIILPGWDSEVIPWLKVFNAYVLYSRWEAMPFSIIEAMHSGLPVIGSAIPSISELVDNDCGYLVPLNDEPALARLFVRIASDFSPAWQKGQRAASKVKQLCSYQNMLSQYREHYLVDSL